MPSLIPYSARPALIATRQERAVARRLSEVSNAALLQRAQDEAQLAIATAKMHDVGVATSHAFEEGESMVNDFQRRVEDDPLMAKALAPLLEDGLQDLRRVRRRVSEGF